MIKLKEIVDQILVENDNLQREQLNEGRFRSMALAGLMGAGTLISPHATFATSNSPTTTMKSEKINKSDIVAATLVGEAGGENEEGMHAVLNVIMNRANGQIEDAPKVCLKQSQFSMWNGKHHDIESVVNVAKQHKNWKVAMELINKANNGTLTDITGGADFYFNPKKAMPDWAKKFEKTKVIGNHTFYHPWE